MEIITTPQQMKDWTAARHAEGLKIALVPTMGYFHDGHLALMRMAAEVAELVVVSLFVNPIQFAPGEDLTRYPRDLVRDRDLAERAGVDVLFVPTVAGMYPGEPRTRISVSGLTERLCGSSRPGHFDGVCTVVAKLFNLIQPDLAIFGRKDFQQLAVIRRMSADLNFDLKVISHPIVREDDGLAMSSRNSYLTPAERNVAPCLFRALQKAQEQVATGEKDSDTLRRMAEQFINSHENTTIEYISIVDANTLEDQPAVGPDSLMALAVRVGSTRLIDNAFLMNGSG
jgi:pantoate--beta-alanine ligase